MAAIDERKALMFIFVTVLIDTIGFGIVIPVFPELIVHLTGRALNEAARIGGWLAFAYAIMQFLCGPLMGNLSDRFGRRPVLLASLTAFSADYVFSAFAPTIGWLFAGRLIAGITGASFTTAYAYIADVTPPEKRAQSFGLMGAAFGLGFILGPALGGLVATFGVRAPFIVAAGFAMLNVAYGYFVLPESLPADRRRPFDIKRANPVGAIVQLRRYHRVVLQLAAAMFVWQFAHQVLQGTWNFYTAYRFGWSPTWIGISLAAVGLVSAVVQGGLTRIIIPKLGERRTIVVGSISGIASFVIYACATRGWVMFAGIAVGALTGLVYPSMNALMSREVEANAQGELQGAVSSLLSLATIVGPLTMTQVFAYFTEPGAPVQVPGAAFVLAAVLATASLAMSLRTARSIGSARP